MKKIATLHIVFLLILSFMVLSEHTASAQQTTENTWKSLKPIPQGDAYEAVTVYGQIHLLSSRNHYVYNPSKDEWTTKKTMTTARNSFGITVYQDKIYVIGGTYGSSGEYFTSDAVEVYDLKTDSWETKTPMPTARSNLCANEIDGKIYLIGGSQTGAAVVGVNEVYDVATDTWITKKPLNNPVHAYASAVVDSKIYILGGYEGLHYGAPVDLNQIYDPKTDTWSRGAQMPHITRNAAAAATTGLLAPKQIYVIGGGPDARAINTTQVYNPQTDTWTLGAEMLSPRGWLTAAVANDIIYAIGGCDNLWGSRLAINERYVPFGYGVIDQINPEETLRLTLISPENKTYYGSKIALEFSSKESLSWVGYRLDAGIIFEIGSNTTLDNLSSGPHNIAVYTTDTDGNLKTTQTIHFTTEKTQPAPLPLILTTTILTASTIIGLGLLIHHKKQKQKQATALRNNSLFAPKE
jgi:N-acetylneuraminic acid mutarotase